MHGSTEKPPLAAHCPPLAIRDGVGGIRTLDRAFQPYNGLANRRLQPLGHHSRPSPAGAKDIPWWVRREAPGSGSNAWRRGGGAAASRSPGFCSRDGVGEIRTHGTVSGSAVFKTAAFDRSATTPWSPNLLSHNALFKSVVAKQAMRAAVDPRGSGNSGASWSAPGKLPAAALAERPPHAVGGFGRCPARRLLPMPTLPRERTGF